MVLRKSTNCVVCLEGKLHTHTCRDSLQEQIRAYGRPWGIPICTVTSEVWIKHHLPKAAHQPKDPLGLLGVNISQYFRVDEQGKMSYPKFWKFLDGTTNRRDSYSYPQKGTEEPKPFLGHWCAHKTDSPWVTVPMSLIASGTGAIKL